MTFGQLPAGVAIFLDANTLIYHFASDVTYGTACTQLLKRVELHHVHGFTSTHVLADVAHRLMTLEAIQLFTWPAAGIAARLRKHHKEIPKLKVFGDAVAGITRSGVTVLPLTLTIVEDAAALCKKHELLTGDALIVAVMHANSLTNLASNDADFDRVPGLQRFAPT